MQAWLEYVVKGLVDHPERVRVTPTQRNNVTHFELRLHPDDVGKVIGKQGATINALRSLLQVGCAKRGIHGVVDIIEESVPSEPPSAPAPQPGSEWPTEPIPAPSSQPPPEAAGG